MGNTALTTCLAFGCVGTTAAILAALNLGLARAFHGGHGRSR
jgi:hypothetical protein